MKKIKTMLVGAAGRMGRRIVSLSKNSNIEIVSAVDSQESPYYGELLSKIVPEANDIIIEEFNSKNVKDVDMVVDFSSPFLFETLLESAVKHKKPLLSGTTGITKEQLKLAHKASEKTPVFYSSNMSYGVNIVYNIIDQLSKMTKDFDVEIIEFHHNKKKDAPSGTALRMAEIITENRETTVEKSVIYGREGLVGARTKEEIAIHAVRGGDVTGEHEIIFANDGERISIKHTSSSRDALALGAIRAAEWLYLKPNGFYSMEDLLSSDER